MPRDQDFEGLRAPGSGEKVSLLVALGEYVDAWTRALGAAPSEPFSARIGELNRRALELQQRCVSSGFGGLTHHLAEYSRLLTAGAELRALQAQLGIVAELASQARDTLSVSERAQLSEAASGGHPAPAPPRMITVMKEVDRGLLEALTKPQERAGSAQAWSAPLAPAPLAPAPLAPAPLVPAPLPPAHLAPGQGLPYAPPVLASAAVPREPANGPQFGVKGMLGLRAFKSPQQAASAAPPVNINAPAKAGGLLSLSPLGPPVAAPVRSSAPPPFVRSDIMGLPRLPPDDGSRYSAPPRKSAPIEPRASSLPLRQSERPERPGRSPTPPRTTPPQVVVRQQRARPRTPSVGLWVGAVGALLLAGMGLVAFLVFGRRPKPPASEVSVKGSSSAVVSESGAALAPRAPGAAPPRERLIADDERFMSLLAQVHGHGGTESPELRSLLNEQAALASKALSGPCNSNSPTCKAWADVRDLLVGTRKTSIVKRRRGSDSESTRSGWMAGLKMPGIPVEDDPRVLRVFEFYTQNPVGRETFQSMLFRCGAYRDLIQSTLIRYDLPPELLALVFAESSCVASAKSPVGAAGLWQFMPETGRAYHLHIIEGTIDERLSPFKSTEAGIRMLADLRLKLGSWDLVFASYNLGPFGVLARLEKAGPDASFWDLVEADLLPEETANYAPTVDAIALILANLKKLKFAGVQIRAPQLTADLEVAGGTRLSLVARAAATSLAQLRSLNLDFSGDVVPVIPGGSIAVQVPKDVVWQARDSIKELLASKDGADQCVAATFDWGKQRFTPEMDQACQRRLSAAARQSP
ncbi:MAG TPA: transglycosylase SLT domain-containing protein [Polyangiaceae bacterium]|nr:transglycosylase SLT domain-containing protein [Polyangiaceae bacterium]